jgi:hypothetical protein
MTGSRVLAFVLLLAAAQQRPSPPPATGLIVGQVIDAASSRPVAGAVVSISGPPTRDPRFRDPRFMDPRLVEPPPPPPRILTGTDGRFVFRDLPRGSYTVTATRNGYAPGAYARRRPAGPSRSITLDDGERVGDVTIRIWRYGAITGTVVDEAGEVVVGMGVRAWRSTIVGGRRRFTGGTGAITDDRGVYRIGNLVPGDYMVTFPIRNVAMPVDLSELKVALARMAGEGNMAPSTPRGTSVIQLRDTAFLVNPAAIAATANDGRLFVYPTTYYPNATAVNQATPVTVGSGEERSAIDFQVRPLQTSSVSGTVIAPDGPRSGTEVGLWPADADDVIVGQDGLTAVTKSNGTFIFPAAPIGNYVLRLHLRPPIIGQSPMMRTVGGASVHPLLWAEMPVAVGRDDITGLEVILRQGLRISGRVEFEGATRRPFPMDLQQVPVTVEPAEGSSFLSSPAALLQSNGQFITPGHAPGRYLLRVDNSPTGWMFKSAVHAGRDIADTPFDLNEDISGVVITFTDRWTGVQGAVRTSRGAADPDATVVVFPTDSDAWTAYGMSPRRVKSARVTPAGTYVVNSVPPGEYFVAALNEEQSADWQDPKILEALSRVAERVIVVEGEKAMQNLVTLERQ